MPFPKRDIVAVCSGFTGITRLLGLLPTRPALLVLNYHRIGNPEDCPYDSEVFSATTDEFDDQIRFLARQFHLAPLEEAIEIIESAKRPRGTAVLLTFDDGYLDHYETAFPHLSARKAPAVFFLPTAFIGTNRIAWWDAIAFIIKHSRKTAFQVNSPSVESFDIAREGVERVIKRVLWMCKLASVQDPESFIATLEEACDSPRPGPSERCFLSWDEAASMVRGGMAIGSHTHSHETLSRLSEERQLDELVTSKRELEERLGIPVHTISYPVGRLESFSSVTRAAAVKAGYRVAFSFYGGCNPFGAIDPYDVRRYAPNARAPRFRLQTTLAAVTSKYWL
jgi:peptidoglycan/xylan/chitin deacetylase (PgdA/CDA1 family)